MKNILKELSFEKAIEMVKNTEFYQRNIDKLYSCEEDPDRIVFSVSQGYTRQEEEDFLNELGGVDFPYILFDKNFMDYLENDNSALTLKEIF